MSELVFDPKIVGACQLARYPLVVDAVRRGINVECRRHGTHDWVDWQMNRIPFLHKGFRWRVKQQGTKNNVSHFSK